MTSYCCDMMDEWSQADRFSGERALMYHGRTKVMTGIRINQQPTFVSIAHCPWCGAKVSEVEFSLIGRAFVEVD